MLLFWGVEGQAVVCGVHLLEAELLTSITEPRGATAAITNNAGTGVLMAYRTQLGLSELAGPGKHDVGWNYK